MSVSVNKVLLAGYLTADPESRQAGSGTVCRFTIGVNRSWTNRTTGQQQEEATFVDCEAWAKLGEIAQNYLRKGRPVLIEGRLKLDKWTTPEGQNRSKLKVTAESVQFLDGAGQGQQDAGGEQAQPATAAAAPYNPEEAF